MPTWLAKLVLQYGAPKVIGAALVLVLALSIGGVVGWSKVQTWYYHHQDTKHVAQRDEARAQTKVARRDEKQVTRAAEISASTVDKQDQHLQATRTETAKATEVIHDRIRQAPVAPAAAPADDPVVRSAADEAYARAQAAADRLQGTPSH